MSKADDLIREDLKQRVSKFVEDGNFEQCFIAACYDSTDSEHNITNITIHAAPWFLAQIVKDVLADNPVVFKALLVDLIMQIPDEKQKNALQMLGEIFDNLCAKGE